MTKTYGHRSKSEWRQLLHLADFRKAVLGGCAHFNTLFDMNEFEKFLEENNYEGDLEFQLCDLEMAFNAGKELQWKPSDKQMKALGVATNISNVPEKEYQELEKLYQDLKKLREK